MEQKGNKPGNKWGPPEDAMLIKMIEEGFSFSEIMEKIGDFDLKDVKRKYHKALKKISAAGKD